MDEMQQNLDNSPRFFLGNRVDVQKTQEVEDD